MYKISRDYENLFELICKGFIVAAFVDYKFSDGQLARDICKIQRLEEWRIMIGVRGMSYGDIYPFDADHGTELEVFKRNCERMNLEWIPFLKVC